MNDVGDSWSVLASPKDGSDRAQAVICVDMGGTTTRVGRCADGLLLPGTVRFDTPKPGAGGSVRDAHLDRIAEVVEQLRGGASDVGLAVGATVDTAGLVRNASMLWHEKCTGFDLAGAVSARLPWARVHIANDIAAAAWRYRSLGRFGLVTVSTGVAVKIFDDALPFDRKLVLDPEGLGGEPGHVRVEVPSDFPGTSLPRCECGNVGDLCSYTSGPAAERLAGLLARAWPDRWRDSKLYGRCQGEVAGVTTRDLAAAAGERDEFAGSVLRVATQPLAGQILHMSALLGLRRFVVMGGFARGVGAPWFAALRANLGRLLPVGGWFTGWTAADLDALVRPSLDADDSLLGMAGFVAAGRARYRELYKPVGERAVTVRGRTRPRCGREQFVTRVAYAGVCGTDLQILRGQRGCEPGVLGHECVAQVVEVGDGVPEVGVGEVIAINPNHPLDEHDKIGHNLPGVLRQLAVWDGHLAARGQAVRLPDEGRAEWVLVEPLACAVRSMRLATDPGRVLVIGGGVSGLLHVLLARRWGARQVVLANRGAERLRLAAGRGLVAEEECLAITPDLLPELAERSGGAGWDTVIFAVSGAGPPIVDRIWPALADGARVHLFGGFPAGSVIQAIPVDPIRAGTPHTVALPDGRACTLVGSRGASAEDFAEAVALATAAPELPLAALISHVVSLDAAPATLAELAATGGLGGEPTLRVLVDLSLAGTSVRAVDGTDLPRLGAAS